jgi:hypothetical protein
VSSLGAGFGRSLPLPVYTTECPYLGCTTYCSDVYKNPVQCGGWVRRPPGLISIGGWENTCTWTIDTVEKKVCCCYSSAWDLFWASDACDCGQSTRVLSTRVGPATRFSAGRNAPFGAPTTFKVSVTCP